MAKRRKATPNEVFSHWFTTIKDFKVTPSEFYRAVEQLIKDRGIPNVRVVEITCKEGGMMSAKRVYLRVGRKDKIFDICAAPYADGCFFSWWMGDKPWGIFKRIAFLLAHIPILGMPFQGLFIETYFKIDTMLMFQDAVRGAVNDTIDGLLTVEGEREPLTCEEKKPIMNL